MRFIPATTLLAGLAASATAAPLNLGSTLLGIDLTLNKLNICLFSNLATMTLKPDTVLDVSSNTCMSINGCLSVKTREVVVRPVLSGLLQVGFCQTKTCPSTQILNSAGVCVTQAAPPKPPTPACPEGRVLNGQGVCICAPGSIFSNSKKEVCISTAECDTRLNTVTDGVCLPKVCADGKLLSTQLGLCVDASICSLRADSLCKEIQCPVNKKLDSSTGLCVSLCADGLLSTPNKQCITVAACSPLLNTVTDGKCVPKTCNNGLLSINPNGICACLPGFTLSRTGTCVVASLYK